MFLGWAAEARRKGKIWKQEEESRKLKNKTKKKSGREVKHHVSFNGSQEQEEKQVTRPLSLHRPHYKRTNDTPTTTLDIIG